MVKIWAKILSDQTIVKSFVFQTDEPYRSKKFYLYLREICHALDLDNPVILSSHLDHFERFRITTFKQTDFVQEIGFDALLLEDVSE